MWRYLRASIIAPDFERAKGLTDSSLGQRPRNQSPIDPKGQRPEISGQSEQYHGPLALPQCPPGTNSWGDAPGYNIADRWPFPMPGASLALPQATMDRLDFARR